MNLVWRIRFSWPETQINTGLSSYNEEYSRGPVELSEAEATGTKHLSNSLSSRANWYWSSGTIKDQYLPFNSTGTSRLNYVQFSGIGNHSNDDTFSVYKR